MTDDTPCNNTLPEVQPIEPAPGFEPEGNPAIHVARAYDRQGDRLAMEQYEAWRQERRERGQNLLDQARRGWAAVNGWDRVETQEQWERLRAETIENWEGGITLLEMLGGTRYVEPERAALCLTLWNDFLVTYQPSGPAEYMVIAMAVLSFDHFLRINNIVQNLQIRLENEFFSVPPLTTTPAPHAFSRLTNGLTVSQVAEQIGLEALPWLDRLNRLVIRNLRALRELKGGTLSLTVANYGQLNVAQRQANRLDSPGRGEGTTKRRKRKGPNSGARARR